MSNVSKKLIVLLVFASLLPLAVFGAIAVLTSQDMARKIVVEENQEIAKRAADQIAQYVHHGIDILEALGQNIGKTDLLQWQKERMIKNYVIQFGQFESIDLTDPSGKIISTSRLEVPDRNKHSEKGVSTVLSGGVYRSEVFISENFVPSMVIGVPLKALGKVEGALWGELNLVEMWNLVDGIRIGEEGYALVVSEEGHLIAHGLGTAKEKVLQQELMGDLLVVGEAFNGKTGAAVYGDDQGEEKIGVSVPIRGLGWVMVIEQPTREAYAPAIRLTWQLTWFGGGFLFLMVMVGMLGGKRYVVDPIRELIRGIREVGKGNLKNKVQILSQDEFQELGETFNEMTGRLVQLQENIRRQERVVTIGRIANGLVHDLRHPIRNLENAAQLASRLGKGDPDHQTFEKVTRRELLKLNQFLDDLLRLSKPKPLYPITIQFSRLMEEFLAPYRNHPRCVFDDQPAKTEGGIRNISISVQSDFPSLKIQADRFALDRVLGNLVNNAIEAMPKGGKLIISGNETQAQDLGKVTEISVSDTGMGISPERIENLFEDFTTTKEKGIGLGLAICKRIVEEHHGKIEIQSKPGQGTKVNLFFPSLS
ncbi:MAG TPA: ATP-binding protein [Nitrospiria bacterium]|jgi:signal transduction histidine kinase